VEGLDLLGAEPAHAQQFVQTPDRAAFEFIQLREAAGVEDLPDFPRQVVADPL
jgi:hypothetical protein